MGYSLSIHSLSIGGIPICVDYLLEAQGLGRLHIGGAIGRVQRGKHAKQEDPDAHTHYAPMRICEGRKSTG